MSPLCHKSIFRVAYQLLFFILYSHIINAQKFVFKQYTVTDGLPHPYIYTLNQTKDGYLWIGTAEGLARYDGKNFELYKTQQGLAENFVNCSYTDKKGVLWYGHYQGGISRLNAGVLKPLTQNNICNSRINSFFQTKNQDIWICTQSNGMLKVEDGNKLLKVDEFNIEDIYWCMAESEGNNILIGSNNGLYYKKNYQKNKKIPEFDGMSVINIVNISDNYFIIATEYDGIYTLKIDVDKYTITAVKHLPHDGFFDGKLIFLKSLAGTHDIWVSMQEKGMLRMYLSNDSLLIKEKYAPATGMSSLNVKSIMVDKENNYWYGTFGNGLYKLKKQVFTLFTFDEPGNQNINCFKFLTDNNILIAFDNNVQLYNYEADFTHTKNNTILKDCHVNYIYKDHLGDLYLATSGIGVLKSKKNKLDFMPWLYTRADLLSNNCRYMTQDTLHNIWIASENNAFLYHLTDKTFNRFGMQDGLSHNFIYSIYTDSKNVQWFATHNSGITRYKEGSFSTLPSPLAIGLNTNCFIEDVDENIWVATNGQGLFKYKNGKIVENYTTNYGLGSNFCYTLVIDNVHNLWIGHKNGISKLSLLNNQVQFIANTDEMQGAEINSLAVQKDRFGNIWYGTNKGLLKYDPSKDIINTTEAQTNITDVKLFYNSIDWAQMGKSSANSTLPSQVVFTYHQNHLTFHYKGICLTDPEKVKYKYYLKGFDNGWSVETDETFVTYSNIPPGYYTFMVLSCNNDGIWNRTPTTFDFEIKPPFWQTLWFNTLVFLLLGSGIYFAFVLRTRRLELLKNKLENDKKVLENEINERKIAEKKLLENEIELKNINDDLNNLLWRSYHDLRGPSSTIQGLVNVALIDTNPESQKRYLTLIMQTVNKLDSILKDFFKVSDIKNSDIYIDKIDLSLCVEQATEKLKHTTNIHKYHIVTHIEQNEPFMADQGLLSVLLSYIIKNAIDFSDEGTSIHIDAKVYKGTLKILISDEGIGIPQSVQDKVFDMFYKATIRSKGNGFGLYISSKIVQMLKGTIHLYSYPAQGTSVLIKLKSITEKTEVKPI
ncbi:MAG: two-component regulator propeller domain-containing protein [Cytophagales bacterium]|nr:two-component regulator propeller domain-containing protein [Cytophagales bacterium]